MCTGFMGPLEPIVKTQLAFSEEAAFPMSHSQSPFLRNEPKDVLTYWFPFCSCVTVIFKFKSQIHTVTSNVFILKRLHISVHLNSKWLQPNRLFHNASRDRHRHWIFMRERSAFLQCMLHAFFYFSCSFNRKAGLMMCLEVT